MVSREGSVQIRETGEEEREEKPIQKRNKTEEHGKGGGKKRGRVAREAGTWGEYQRRL